MQEIAFVLGVLLFACLSFAVFFVFGLSVAIVTILIVNLVFLTLTGLSLTSAWHAHRHP